MADFKKLIPFIIYFETGVKDSKADSRTLFLKAKAKGVANDPADLGGDTLVGVTAATYKKYCRKVGKATARLQDLSFQDWSDILKVMFWDRWHADDIRSQKVAEMLVDWVWNSGAYGITIPQRMLGCKADGIVGPVTLAAVNDQNPDILFSQLRLERLAYIERICNARPANAKFRNGWVRRINSVGNFQ